jgi:phosphate transport system substrate-binding protein
MRNHSALFHYCCVLALAIAGAGYSTVRAAPAAEEIRIGGTGNALGTMRLLGEAFARQNPGATVTVLPSLGSGGGIKAAANGAVQIAVTSRPLKEEERGLGLVESEYARTPFVFAVSANSRVSALTTAEIANLYAGRTQSWPDGSRIRLVLRPAGDSDSEQIRRMSPEIAVALGHAEKIPGTPFAMNDQENANDLERIPGAFGSTTLALIKSEQRSLKALELDGVAVTVQNGTTGRYPHYTRLYLVTQPNQSSGVQRFIAFLRSPDGVAILTRNGNWAP